MYCFSNLDAIYAKGLYINRELIKQRTTGTTGSKNCTYILQRNSRLSRYSQYANGSKNVLELN